MDKSTTAGEMTLEHARELIGKYPWFKAPRVVVSAAEGTADPMLDIQFTFFPQPDVLRKEASGGDFHNSFVIESFLSLSDPHIIPAEDIPEGDMSAAGVFGGGGVPEDDDDDLVTEELAEIYLAQGLKTEAKEIYRKLSLLYPEKSVYFAELIAKIESGN